MTTAPPIEADALRLRDEFLAMPGLSLTPSQTARLLSVRLAHALRLLEELRAEGFLTRTDGEQYRRASDVRARPRYNQGLAAVIASTPSLRKR